MLVGGVLGISRNPYWTTSYIPTNLKSITLTLLLGQFQPWKNSQMKQHKDGNTKYIGAHLGRKRRCARMLFYVSASCHAATLSRLPLNAKLKYGLQKKPLVSLGAPYIAMPLTRVVLLIIFPLSDDESSFPEDSGPRASNLGKTGAFRFSGKS